MRYYENLFIVNPGYEGDTLQSIKDEFARFISENGGRIYNIEEWGKRRLAYRIDKQKYGIYILIEFAAEGPLIRELEESQSLNDAVLNYLTVRLDSEPDMSEKRKKYIEEEEDEEYDEHEMDDEEEEEDEEEENSTKKAAE